MRALTGCAAAVRLDILRLAAPSPSEFGSFVSSHDKLTRFTMHEW